MPRKCALTPETEKRLLDAIRAGNYVETAAAYVGVAKQTFYTWLKRGAKGEARFKAFADAVLVAQAESEARDVALIGKAAVTQWQAAAWRLERKFPDKWGRKERVDVDQKVSGSIEIRIAFEDSWTVGDARASALASDN